MTAAAYTFPPVRVEARNLWPGDILPIVAKHGARSGCVAGLHFHNSHPAQPVSVVFDDGTHLTFSRTELVYVSKPARSLVRGASS